MVETCSRAILSEKFMHTEKFAQRILIVFKDRTSKVELIFSTVYCMGCESWPDWYVQVVFVNFENLL